MASDLMKAMFSDPKASEKRLETADVPSLSQACPKSVPIGIAEKILRMGESSIDAQTLMEAAEHTNRTRFRSAILKLLIEAGLLEPTIPEKPRSSKQKYRLTRKAKRLLEIQPNQAHL